MLETTVILRAILFQLLETEDIEKARAAVMAMCTKDDVAAVKEQLANIKNRK